MKYLYTFVYILFLSVLCCLNAGAFELKHEVKFSRDKVKTEDIEVKGMEFTSVCYDDFIKIGEPGEARLPYDILEFEVPSDIYSFSISVKTNGANTIPVNHGVEISQKPVISGYSHENEPALISQYTSSQFPDCHATIVQDGYRNGDIHMLHVAVYPFSYDAANKRLTFVESIEVTISEDSGIPVRSSLATTYTSPLRPLQKLDNSSLAKTLSESGQPRFTPTVGNGLPSYEYTVITSRKLAPAFDRIIGLKKQKGLDAGVVCIEDILADAAFSKGDTISGINDNAGKLRSYLTACRQSRDGDMFVLLGGNNKIIPVRNAYEENWHYINIDTLNRKNYYFPHPYGDSIPTDLYYADINGNWDYNNNGKYAEFEEKHALDFNPDIYVGRICCKNQQEISNYTSKLIKYELNPGNGDFSYLKKQLSTQADHMQLSNQANISSDLIKEIFEYAKIVEELPDAAIREPISPTGTQIIDEINNTKYGFINFHAHGGAMSLTTKSKRVHDGDYYGLVSSQRVPERLSNAINEDGHGLDMLNNYDYPAICYSLGCDLMPYDNMLMYAKTLNGGFGDFELIVPEYFYNFGDSYTIGGKYGGPAFIGNTRYVLVAEGFDQELEFLKLLKSDGCLGRVHKLTQTKFVSNLHCRLTHNLLGCPEFKMWIKPPQLINYTIQPFQTNSFWSIFSDEGTFVTYIRLTDGVVVNLQGSGVNQVRKFTFPKENVVASINGDYKIPQQMNLLLSDVTINAGGYYFVQNINTSNTTLPYTPKIIFSNARVTFEVEGLVDLKQPLIIGNGSDVTFIAAESASFCQMEVKIGSKLTIDPSGN